MGLMLNMSLTTRLIRINDLAAVQPLIWQLGYELTPAETKDRFRAVMSAEGHAIFVGELDARIVGLFHIFARPALDKPPEAVVQALVVDASARQSGVGKALMETAESWASQRGFRSVALASSISRDAAHAFYKAIGYSVFATSHLFRKCLL
jgi:GNAT superfamily N-acetyltransferase